MLVLINFLKFTANYSVLQIPHFKEDTVGWVDWALRQTGDMILGKIIKPAATKNIRNLYDLLPVRSCIILLTTANSN